MLMIMMMKMTTTTMMMVKMMMIDDDHHHNDDDHVDDDHDHDDLFCHNTYFHFIVFTGEKLKWFQDNLDCEKNVYTKQEAREVIER